MRRWELIVGNWKMNGMVETARSLTDEIRVGLSQREERQLLCEVVISPPFTALHAVHQHLQDSSIKLGAQNMSAQQSGAFTGEICGLMLRDVGCRYVILGHSERRSLFGETDQSVMEKVVAAYVNGLTPIVCLGEGREDRDGGRTLDVVGRQMDAIFPALPDSASKQQQLVVAYEPVWAIGTGLTATTGQIQEVHAFLRKQIQEKLGSTVSRKIRILYGGSVNAGNAKEILALEDVDGALIGGAALKAKEFLSIIDSVPGDA
ncbi:MAG: triose-phosphate isomerase [Magnetococcales bacterium]|nr:triose-phosphate isomerase [Magnetococcales bacterium]